MVGFSELESVSMRGLRNTSYGTRKNILRWAVPFALTFVLTMTACSGGWAVVAVKDLPHYLLAGETLTFTFDVLRLGQDEWPLLGLEPIVEATAEKPGGNATAAPGRKPNQDLPSIVSWFRGTQADAARDQENLNVSVAAIPGSKPGRYSATLTLPSAGDWTISVHTGFGNSTATLLPIKVMDTDDPFSAAMPLAERGKHLFVAKGCVGCHRHQDIGRPIIRHPKNSFTQEEYPESYLRAVLTDPDGTFGVRFWAAMPNLNLSADEVEALVAFINQ